MANTRQWPENKIGAAINALSAAIEQAEKQEPVAWANINKHGDITHTNNKRMPWSKTPLYTTPPAQPAKQKPVAWNSGVPPLYPEMKDGETISVEYVEATPPAAQQGMTIDASAPIVMTPHPAFAKRQWVGLTDDEIMEILDYGQHGRVPQYARNFVDAIEAKLKEKNNG